MTTRRSFITNIFTLAAASLVARPILQSSNGLPVGGFIQPRLAQWHTDCMIGTVNRVRAVSRFLGTTPVALMTLVTREQFEQIEKHFNARRGPATSFPVQ